MDVVGIGNALVDVLSHETDERGGASASRRAG